MNRYEHLDGLRGLAALVVMLVHGIIMFDFALYSGNPHDSVASWDLWLSGAPFQLPNMANCAVCLFFVLSGFVLSHSFLYTHHGVIALAAKRYVRLGLPILSVCLFVYGLLVLELPANHQAALVTHSSWLDSQLRQQPAFWGAVKQGLLSALRIFPFGESYDANLWTMPIEFAGSLLLVLLFGILKFMVMDELRIRTTARIFIIVIAGAFSTSYLGLFGVGAFLYLTYPNGLTFLRARPLLTGALIVCGIFLGTIPAGASPWPILGWFLKWPPLPAPVFYAFAPWAFWHAIGAVLILLAVLSSEAVQRFLRHPGNRWLGAISFPLYLVHLPLLMVVGCRGFLLGLACGMAGWLAAGVAFVLFVAVSLAVAHGAMLTVERPAISLSGRTADWITSLFRQRRIYSKPAD